MLGCSSEHICKRVSLSFANVQTLLAVQTVIHAVIATVLTDS